MASDNIYAAILAGGIGSRFWPLSRETSPKQLLRVVDGESLLESTIKRLAPLIPSERVSIVTSEKQADIIRCHLDAGSVKADGPHFIVEPEGRNTAPAIGLAALRIFEEDPDAIMAVLPADHMIIDSKPFRASLEAAIEAAADGSLVTFGIVPRSPETGYGYIKSAVGQGGQGRKVRGFTVSRVERFVEKPDLERAKKYIAEGDYYWNSGIFVWKASRILEELGLHLPATYRALMRVKDGANLRDAYKEMDAISIDHAVLEKASAVVVIEANFPWSDMGSWTSLADVLPSDKDGNVIKGRVVDIGSANSIIMGSERVLATIGLTDMVIVDTPDATLVCPKGRAQDVKDIVAALKKNDWVEHELHLTVERPWGSYTVLEEGAGYKVKRIKVLAGKRLSLQSHEKRSEHWVVIAGTARVRRGDETLAVSKNESTFIPMGVKHRLENPGKEPLEIIEVQNGSYLGEDDITRYDDDYKRGSPS
jgi:mannose-1-phosphate guanylyltransferase/mannose-6-phosphate isomerase